MYNLHCCEAQMPLSKSFSSEIVRTFVGSMRTFGAGPSQAIGLATPGCNLLVTAFKAFAEHKRAKLDDLFSESDRYLYPFEDPLRTDMMLPAFLAGEREELYSDMLAWIFKLLHAREVFDILGIARIHLTENDPVEFKREHCIKVREMSGRFDLLVSQAGKWLIVLEVKTKEYDDTALAKHELYNLAIEQTSSKHHCARIFIASRNTGADLRGFEFLSWADLCVRLRSALPSVLRVKTFAHTQTALLLAFIGSIEQNLLGFNTGQLSSAPAIAQHIDRVVKYYQTDDKRQENA